MERFLRSVGELICGNRSGIKFSLQSMRFVALASGRSGNSRQNPACSLPEAKLVWVYGCMGVWVKHPYSHTPIRTLWRKVLHSLELLWGGSEKRKMRPLERKAPRMKMAGTAPESLKRKAARAPHAAVGIPSFHPG